MDDDLTAKYASLVRTLTADANGLHRLGLTLREDFHCDRTTLFLKAARGVYVSIYAEGLDDMTLTLNPGEGIVGKAIQRRAPVVSNEASYDPDALSRLRDHYSGYETRSLLAAPIPGRFFGVQGAVQLVNKLRELFTDDDVRRLTEAAAGLRGLRRFCRRPTDNLWDPSLHQGGRHARAPSA